MYSTMQENAMPINEAAQAMSTVFVSVLEPLRAITEFLMLRRASHMNDTKPSMPVSRISSRYNDCVCAAPSIASG